MLIAISLGLTSGIFLWPWMYIIFGWPGASIGAALTVAVKFRTHLLILSGALISASLVMSIVAIGLDLIVILLAAIAKKAGRFW